MAASYFTRYAQERAYAVDWLKMSEGSRNPDAQYGGTYYTEAKFIIPFQFRKELEQYLIKEAQSGSYNKQREQYLTAQHNLAADQGDCSQAR